MKILLLILMVIQLVSTQRGGGGPPGKRGGRKDRKGRPYEIKDGFTPGAHGIGKSKLKEMEFESKARYVVSSNIKNDASIEFDLQIHPYNYENIDESNFIRLYVILAEAKVE